MTIPSHIRQQWGRWHCWRRWLLDFALIGWVTGYWWARDRWEHGLWLHWIVLASFVCNADHIWVLWKEWFGNLGKLGEGLPKNLWWFGLFALIEGQFWLTGLRTGDWWGPAGSGKDLVLLVILISGLVLLARADKVLAWLWRMVVAVGFLAIAVSAIEFYGHYGISEERFRLVWRYAPGFNAVTTGILVGFTLIAATGSWLPWSRALWLSRVALWLLLIVLGAALAASESRGALLAVLSALVVSAGQSLLQLVPTTPLGASRKTHLSRLLRLLLPPSLGYLAYWVLARGAGESSSDLINRGSAGRLDIYQAYLVKLRPLDWLLGQGHVPSLPAEELGWLVHHPHSAYLGQLVGYGVLGVLALVVLLLTAVWKIRRTPELPLVIFGLTASLFDGGQIFTVLSLARWETLVVLVPLIAGVARSNNESSVQVPVRS